MKFYTDALSAGNGVQEASIKAERPLRLKKGHVQPTMLNCVHHAKKSMIEWEHLEVHIRTLNFFARDAFEGQGESCGNALAGHQLSDMIMRFEYCLAFVVHYRDP
jgi:hypothetical protein